MHMISAEMSKSKVLSTQAADIMKFVLYLMWCKSPLASHSRPIAITLCSEEEPNAIAR
jgi:hypothetical protein